MFLISVFGTKLFRIDKILYNSSCPSVGRSVGRWVGRSVGRSVGPSVRYLIEIQTIEDMN